MKKGLKFTVQLDPANLVRTQSREQFRDMPRMKRIGDKRNKKPRYKEKWDE